MVAASEPCKADLLLSQGGVARSAPLVISGVSVASSACDSCIFVCGRVPRQHVEHMPECDEAPRRSLAKGRGAKVGSYAAGKVRVHRNDSVQESGRFLRSWFPETQWAELSLGDQARSCNSALLLGGVCRAPCTARRRLPSPRGVGRLGTPLRPQAVRKPLSPRLMNRDGSLVTTP